MSDTPDEPGRDRPGPDADPAEPRTRAKVTWKGIVDVPVDEEPGRSQTLMQQMGGRGGSSRGSSGSNGAGMPRRRKRAVLITGLVVIVGLLIVSTAHITKAGYVSVPVTFGSAQPALDEGLHFTPPWPITLTNDMSVQTQNYTMTAADIPDTDDPVLVLGLDGASATVQATLLYRLEPTRASDVYREIGTDFSRKLVQPTTRSCIRSEFANYDMVQAATGSLEEVTQKIRGCISDKIDPQGISLQDLQIREVTLGDQVQKAVNDKVSAEQDADRQKFELDRAQQQADIARVNADATADAQQILACGATLETVERDGATIEVVVPNGPDRCVAPALSPEILEYNYIQMLREVLKANGNNTVIVNGSGSGTGDGVTPLVNVTPGSTPPTTTP